MPTSRAFPHFETRTSLLCAWQASSQKALFWALCVLKMTYTGSKCTGFGGSLSAPVSKRQRMPVSESAAAQTAHASHLLQRPARHRWKVLHQA